MLGKKITVKKEIDKQVNRHGMLPQAHQYKLLEGATKHKRNM